MPLDKECIYKVNKGIECKWLCSECPHYKNVTNTYQEEMRIKEYSHYETENEEYFECKSEYINGTWCN